MNLYFICVSMIITSSRFPFVIGGYHSKKSEEAKNIALEMIFDTETREIYYPRDDIDFSKIKLEENQRFFYACPQFRNWHSTVISVFEGPCLFPKLISDGRAVNVECGDPVIPFVRGNDVNDPDELEDDSSNQCGEDGENGMKHAVYYQIFVGTEMENVDYTTANWDMMPEEALLTKTINLYSACFYKNTRETIFVTYDIISLTSSSKPIPKRFGTTFSQYSKNDVFQLNGAPEIYKKENQIQAIPFINSPWNTNGDYIVEQMLVPQDDLPYDLQKGSVINYLNVSPQWKSLRDDWIKLNEFVKRQSVKVSWKSLFQQESSNFNSRSLAFTYTRFSVSCGVYGHLKNHDLRNPADKADPSKTPGKSEEIEKRPNSSDPSDQSHYHHSHNPLGVHVSVLWWKYIKLSDSDDTGIVLLMPNFPKVLPVPDSIRLFCSDICDRHGWSAVKAINANIICCRPTYKLLGKLMRRDYFTNVEKILSLESDNTNDTPET